jgi:hypothetical protein
MRAAMMAHRVNLLTFLRHQGGAMDTDIVPSSGEFCGSAALLVKPWQLMLSREDVPAFAIQDHAYFFSQF